MSLFDILLLFEYSVVSLWL